MQSPQVNPAQPKLSTTASDVQQCWESGIVHSHLQLGTGCYANSQKEQVEMLELEPRHKGKLGRLGGMLC
jgi:hypothetical protein